MTYYKFLFLLFISTFAFTLSAQDNQDWEVVVFDGEQLVIINADDSLDLLEIPAKMLEIIDPVSYNPMILSDDHRYFVSITNPDRRNFSGYTITIADLHNQTCCITVSDPFDGGLLDIILGVFDENNQYFTATIGYGLPDGTRDAMIVVDVETGEIVYQVDPKEHLDGARFVEFINWDNEGIRLVPWKETEPYSYDFADSNAIIWQPDTNEFMIDNNHFDGFNGDYLPATGEYLRWTSSDDNLDQRIIEVISEGDIDNRTAVFKFAKGDFLPHPFWVLDGRAYIMRQEGNAGVVIFRDGTILDVELEVYTRFIAGTPDGWLLQQTRPSEQRILLKFTVVDNEVQITPIMTFDSILLTVQKPALGQNLDQYEEWMLSN